MHRQRPPSAWTVATRTIGAMVPLVLFAAAASAATTPFPRCRCLARTRLRCAISTFLGGGWAATCPCGWEGRKACMLQDKRWQTIGSTCPSSVTTARIAE